MTSRSFRCIECGVTSPAGDRGPVPDRCKKCRTRSKNRRARIRRSGLEVVPDAAGPPPLPDPQTCPEGLAAKTRRDLDQIFSDHPAAESLGHYVVWLATLLESPMVLLDLRTAAALGKEWRSALDHLVTHEGAQDDDDLGGVPAPVVVS
jgi:hypothetical protein